MIARMFRILVFLVLFFLLLFIPSAILFQRPRMLAETTVTIAKGTPLRGISHQLEQAGVIPNAFLFTLYAVGLRQGGKIQAGDYLFSGPISPRQVLQKLVEGKVVLVQFKIIEGWTVREIASAMTPELKEEFLRIAKDQSLEGILFPETYFFHKETTAGEMIKIFTAEFEKNYEQLTRQLPTPPTLTQHEIVTLASLIEKETGAPEERPIIASVFYNRLKIGMALQSDPTVIYGLKNFDGNIRKADLTNPHPYNTYVHAGLPPGPICNPGRASLQAALQPAQTDYLYFVSKNDGTHYFSKTAAEHFNAVQKYQRSLR